MLSGRASSALKRGRGGKQTTGAARGSASSSLRCQQRRGKSGAGGRAAGVGARPPARDACSCHVPGRGCHASLRPAASPSDCYSKYGQLKFVGDLNRLQEIPTVSGWQSEALGLDARGATSSAFPLVSSSAWGRRRGRRRGVREGDPWQVNVPLMPRAALSRDAVLPSEGHREQGKDRASSSHVRLLPHRKVCHCVRD